MKRLGLKSVGAIVLSLASAGCSGGILGVGEGGELQVNRSRWQAAGIVDYTYQVDRGCFCGFAGPHEIQVRDGLIVAVIDLRDGSAVEAQFFDFFDTVEDLFDIIERAIANQAAVLEVDYHVQLGYPTRIELDGALNVADDELTVTVSRFVDES